MQRTVRFSLIPVFLFLIFCPAFAQNPKADSLYAILIKQNRQDTAHARLLLDYAAACFPGTSDSTFKYNEIAFRLSEKLDYQYGLMRGLNGFALKAWWAAEFEKANGFYRQALVIADRIKDAAFQMKILNNMGVLYQSMGIPDSAIANQLKSLEIARQMGDEKMQAKCLSDLGSASGLKGDYLQSVKYLVQALSIYEKIGSLNDLVMTHVRLGNQYSKIRDFRKSRNEYFLAEQLNDSLKNGRYKLDILINTGLLFQHVTKDYDSARYYRLQGYELAKTLNMEDGILSANVNLGNIYYNERNFEKALEYYIQAFNSPHLKGRAYEQTAVLVNLGSVHMNLGNTGEADKLLVEGLALATKNHFHEFQKIACESLSTLAFKRKNFEQAYRYLLQAYELNDSLYNQELKEQIAEIQFQHQLEAKETENKLLVNENKIKEQVIFRQQLIVAGGLIIILLIIILVLVLLRSGSNQRVLNRKLDEQNRNLTELNHTKDKFFSIVAHDLKSPFNALMALLVELDEGYGEFDEASRKRIIHLLRESSFNTYNLLVNLLEWARTQQERIGNQAEDVWLSRAVDEVITVLNTRALMKSQSLVNDVSPDTKIYADPQIIQSLLINLLNNGIKFTPPSGSVRVFTRSTAGFISVSVEDSGIGIPENEIPNLFRIDASFKRPGTEKEPGTGLGLIMCKEYIQILGGEIIVASQVGKGTTVSFTVPVSGNGHSKY